MAKLSLAQAPAFRYKVKGGKKVVELYDACHLHWRAGLIESWYYGRRSPDDPTIVWELNGREWPMSEISYGLGTARHNAGVESIAWGETWCGYRAVVVTYSDGSSVTESWDSARQVVSVG